jgi:hypothetical protein
MYPSSPPLLIPELEALSFYGLFSSHCQAGQVNVPHHLPQNIILAAILRSVSHTGWLDQVYATRLYEPQSEFLFTLRGTEKLHFPHTVFILHGNSSQYEQRWLNGFHVITTAVAVIFGVLSWACFPARPPAQVMNVAGR